MIKGKRYDFTEEQFQFSPVYTDIKSNREEAFSDINLLQYNYLSGKFFSKMEK